MKKLPLLLLALALAPSSKAEDQITNITIYGNSPQTWNTPFYYSPDVNLPGYAILSFARQINFAQGVNTVAVTAVPDEVDTSSIMLKNLGRNLQVAEQSFISSKLNADDILKRNIGKQVEVEKQAGNSISTTKGTLLNAVNGLIVKDGSEVKLIQDYTTISVADENYSSGNMIKWLVNSSNSSDSLFEYAYKTQGIAWSASYNVYIDGQSADVMAKIEGWADLVNNTGINIKQTNLKLVAGETAQAPQSPRAMPMMAMAKAGGAMEAADAAAPTMEEQKFSDLHMYTIGRKVDLPAHSAKKIKLFDDKEGVIATKKYMYEGATGDNNVKTVISILNDDSHHLGVPLPGGRYRVFAKDNSGQFEQIGEVSQEHRGENEKVELAVGNSFDLKAKRNQADGEQDALRRRGKYTVTVDIESAMDKDVDVTIKEPMYQQNWSITSSTFEYKKINTSQVEFAMKAKAKASTRLEYVVEYSW